MEEERTKTFFFFLNEETLLERFDPIRKGNIRILGIPEEKIKGWGNGEPIWRNDRFK